MLILFNNTAPDAPYLSVVSQHMHVPIAPPEKRAQNPANDSDDDCTPERTPKVIHMESDYDARHHEQ